MRGWGSLVAVGDFVPAAVPPPVPPPVIIPPPLTPIFDTFDRVTEPAYTGGGGTPSSGTDGDYDQDGPFDWYPGPYGPDDAYDAVWCDGSLLNHFSANHDRSDINLYYPPTYEPPVESPVLELLNDDCIWTARFRVSEVGFEATSGYGEPSGYFSSLEIRFALQSNDGPTFAVTVRPNGPSCVVNPGVITLAQTSWSDYFHQADGVTAAPASTASKTDWVANTWYTVKVEWHPSVQFALAKVWADGDTEPDWMVNGYGRVATNPTFGPLAYAILGSFRGTRYTDLDTPTDSLVQFDDFISVVPSVCALVEDFGTVRGPGWGTATPGGWTYSYWPPSGDGAQARYSSDGTVGRVDFGSDFNPGTPEVFFGPSQGLSFDSFDPGPWNASIWTFSGRFKINGWTYGGFDGYTTVMLKTNSRRVYLAVGSDFGHVQPNGYIQTDDSGIVDFDWHPDTWYRVKWYYNNITGDSWLKVWLDGDPEPGWLITESSYGGLGGDDPTGYFSIQFNGSGFNGSNQMYWDDLTFCTSP